MPQATSQRTECREEARPVGGTRRSLSPLKCHSFALQHFPESGRQAQSTDRGDLTKFKDFLEQHGVDVEHACGLHPVVIEVLSKGCFWCIGGGLTLSCTERSSMQRSGVDKAPNIRGSGGQTGRVEGSRGA